MKRSRTNTPLQALELLNDVTYVEAARRLAQLTIARGGRAPTNGSPSPSAARCAQADTTAELAVLRNGLDRYVTAFRTDRGPAGQLIHHGESPVDEKIDPAELAAYTATARVILNLDETITLE